MKTLSRILTLGMTLTMLGVTGNALAQWDDHGCGGREHMQQMRERHQAELHDKLKLNAEQEKAWQEFVAKGKELRSHNRFDPKELAGLTAPQRMQKMLDRMHEHEEHMGKMLDALKDFYGVLTPQQQKIFDESTPGGHRMHGERRPS